MTAAGVIKATNSPAYSGPSQEAHQSAYNNCQIFCIGFHKNLCTTGENEIQQDEQLKSLRVETECIPYQ